MLEMAGGESPACQTIQCNLTYLFNGPIQHLADFSLEFGSLRVIAAAAVCRHSVCWYRIAEANDRAVQGNARRLPRVSRTPRREGAGS